MASPILKAIGVAAIVMTPAWSQWHLESVLNGAGVVPPSGSSATGLGRFTLNRPANTITYHLAVSGMSGTSAHLHLGAAGAGNPAILHPLSGGATVWQGTTPALTPADVVTLLNEGIFVDVHSAAFPGGEIRGQLVPVRRTNFVATLNQAQHVPPTGSTATGVGRARLNEPEGRLIYDLQTTGVVNPTAANIHLAPAGVNGPALFNLNGGPSHWCGVSPVLSASDIASLKANGCYFHIHTSAFPNGEIRGQMMQRVQPFSVTLDGSQENPPTGSGVTGCGRVDYDPATNTLAYSINHGVLPSGTLFAHIHRGVVGQNGSIVFNLGPGPTSWSGTTPALSAANLADLFKGNLYVNVHSNAFGGGEIRGQVRPDPYVFGFGGDGAPGKPRIDAAGYDGAASNSVTLSVTNALSGAPVSVFIGLSSSFSFVLGTQLPVLLSPVGHVWIDPDLGSLIPLVADSTGCASITVGVPTDPAFDCFKGYVQCAVTDPINAASLVVSDALELQVLP
jgi:hypothetical protein